ASKSSTSTSIHRARTHRSGRSDADCRPRSSPAIANRKPRRAVPRRVSCKIDHRDEKFSVLGRPGSDLLFQALRLSTIGAKEFNGRVRDGIGYRLLAMTTRPAKDGTDEASDLSLMDIDLMRAFKPIERLVPVS